MCERSGNNIHTRTTIRQALATGSYDITYRSTTKEQVFRSHSHHVWKSIWSSHITTNNTRHFGIMEGGRLNLYEKKKRWEWARGRITVFWVRPAFLSIIFILFSTFYLLLGADLASICLKIQLVKRKGDTGIARTRKAAAASWSSSLLCCMYEYDRLNARNSKFHSLSWRVCPFVNRVKKSQSNESRKKCGRASDEVASSQSQQQHRSSSPKVSTCIALAKPSLQWSARLAIIRRLQRHPKITKRG